MSVVSKTLNGVSESQFSWARVRFVMTKMEYPTYLLAKNGQWRLSPAYDITHAYNSRGQWTYQHLMSVNSVCKNITRDDLLNVGDRFFAPRYKEVIKQVMAALARWPEFAAQAGISEVEALRIQRDFVTI